jgi:hypothetical protein
MTIFRGPLQLIEGKRVRTLLPRLLNAVIFASMTQRLSITSALDGYAINIAEF